MSESNVPKPVMLIVLDGWGLGEKNKSNAMAMAKLPTIDKLNSFYPHIALQASGISVGLPWGEMGNSEVGHMTMGAGKVIYQNMPRITMAIQDGEFYENPTFLKAIENIRERKSALHLMGLIGKGSVHSSMDHLWALLDMMQKQKIEKVYVHAFTDGRDSPGTSGVNAIGELKLKLEKFGVGKIASISGRYWAMDRNNNWDRTQKAYDMLVKAAGNQIEDAEEYLKDSYKKGTTDEFIEPAVILENGQPVAKIQDGDSVIFFNYREDRARQLTAAFAVPKFNSFPRTDFKNLFFVTMTQYEEGLPVNVAFPPIIVEDCLGKILSQNNLKQLRIAETEKFAHVTYFFNVGNEGAFPGEDRTIVPSKDVSSFDKVPEMSAEEITDKVIQNLERNIYDFILINFANADMVGHTGNEEATIQAVEVVDECLKRIITTALPLGGQLLITADHGNAEEMMSAHTGEKDTEHSVNPVPFWYVTPTNAYASAQKEDPEIKVSGLLSDVAPTILEILGIKKPDDMTGESLLSILK